MSMIDNLIRPVLKPRLHDQISEQINNLIAEGMLKPGDRLPAERELAERFKVSRNSVRDALRTLEARGLVEIRQGDGTYIRETTAAELYQAMIDVLALKKETLLEIMQVRKIIEPGVAYYAAQNVTPEKMAQLEEIVARHEAKAGVGDPGVEEDSQFHYSIAAMTGNGFLVRLLQLINENLKESREIILQYPDTKSATRLGHRRILQALANRDPEAAQEAMAGHIDEVMSAYELFEGEG